MEQARDLQLIMILIVLAINAYAISSISSNNGLRLQGQGVDGVINDALAGDITLNAKAIRKKDLCHIRYH